MNELSFLVLTALADGPQHGYGMLQEIHDLTDGRNVPSVASLYRTIDRLGAEGLVTEAGTEVVDGRFRRIHRLTDDGRTVLADEAEQRARTARLAFRRLGRGLAPDPGPANQAGGPITGGAGGHVTGLLGGTA